ncbi:hypothetical protein WSM22_17850 [Cytophagales bacterium WSM2-2]|nr:hypothetical protein WSM22_17850 [Cytophagales bacterium WSM2-2]
MKNESAILFFFILLFCNKSAAQVTQLELTAGFNKSDFSSFNIKPLDEKNKFSVSTLAFFQKFYRNEDLPYDETGVQTSVYRNFSKSAHLGPSLYYNSVAGFSEKLSFLFLDGRKHLVVVVIPSVFHTEKDNNVNGDVFMQIQYSRPLKNDWSVLTYAQLFTTWKKFSEHTRSFQQVRTGVAYKNNQFGVSLDFDEYGSIPVTKTTIGIFLRKVILDN